jgi:hypothetical protein
MINYRCSSPFTEKSLITSLDKYFCLNLSLNSDDDDVGDRLPRAQLSSSLSRPGGGERKNKIDTNVCMYCDSY